MKFTYLLIDLFTVIIPLLFSFHPKIKFYKTWDAFFPAVIITGIVFLIWDAGFTGTGVWGFNPEYLTGITIGNLPIEEILFFFCIPYACMFTFYCLDLFIPDSTNQKLAGKITPVLIAFLLITGLINYDKVYTSFTFLSLAVLLSVTRYILHISWLPKFYIVYILLLFPFLIVNGVLTGTGLENPVVWYNNDEIMGIRILTIPFEDIFYGMELILLNLMLYQYLLFEIHKKSPVK